MTTKILIAEPPAHSDNVPVILPGVELTVVCPGWGLDHGLIVMHAGPDGSRVSHGMCERCELFTDASDRVSGPTLEEYRTYLLSQLDPRD